MNYIKSLAIAMDLLKLTRRLVLFCYGVLIYMTTTWFMSLDNPTVEQAGFLSVVVGASTLVFAFYSKNPNDYSKLVQPREKNNSGRYNHYRNDSDDFYDS